MYIYCVILSSNGVLPALLGSTADKSADAGNLKANRLISRGMK